MDKNTPANTASADARAGFTPILAQQAGLLFAVLVGSRANGQPRPDSDWDIALMWAHDTDGWHLLGQTETLRRALALAIGVPEGQIDLIDLRRANLAMRATVAQDGQPLWIGDALAWSKFLQRTWREVETFMWTSTYGT